MKRFQRIILSLFLLTGVAFQGNAQSVPAEWKYEVKKTGKNKYTLIFKLKLNSGYHIYSFNPGLDDGSLIPPSFSFNKNAKVKLLGKTREEGKLITEKIEDIGTLRYFKQTVTYSQDISVTGNTVITGEHIFQLCDESSCLRPEYVKFSFKITDAIAVNNLEQEQTSIALSAPFIAD